MLELKLPARDMPEPPRRALQLPSVPGRVPLVGDDAIAAAALSMPQQPSRQRRAAGPRSWRVHGEASASSIAGGGSGPADGHLDRCGTSGAHDMVDILQEEILKRDEWLAAKEEQMRAKTKHRTSWTMKGHQTPQGMREGG